MAGSSTLSATGTRDKHGQRADKPGNQPADGKDLPLQVRWHFRLPDGLVGAVDDGYKEHAKKASNCPDGNSYDQNP